MNKPIIILGGGTFYHVRNHFSLAAPAFGTTARWLHERLAASELVLTKMADYRSDLETNADVANFLEQCLQQLSVKVIVMNVAMCDYEGQVGALSSGKHAERLRTKEGQKLLTLQPSSKVIARIRQQRPDVQVVGFKTTTNHSPAAQKARSLPMLQASSCSVVLANDTITRNNIIVNSEEEVLVSTKKREVALSLLVDIIRSFLI